MVLTGSERYNVHGFAETVRPGECLVVNEDQPYESSIQESKPVETLCVFFTSNDAADAAKASLPVGTQLDDPGRDAPSFEFAAVKRTCDGVLGALAAALPDMRDTPHIAQEEHTSRLLQAMIAWERPNWRAATRFQVLKASTRAELMRRCMIARAFIEATYVDDISLAQVARVAGLSRTHLLRAFRQCFGETPYQALLRLRLERAKDLLVTKRHTVSEVGLSVGYENFSAFARAFRRRFGVAPSTYCD